MPAVGLDFGTTNSSLALAQADGTVRFAEFPFQGTATRSSRSVLYLQRRSGALAKPAQVWTGPQAIEHYLSTDHFEEDIRGRLIHFTVDGVISAIQMYKQVYCSREGEDCAGYRRRTRCHTAGILIVDQ